MLISNFAPNLFQSVDENSSENIDDDLLIMASGSMEHTIKLGDFVRIDRQIAIECIHAAPANADPPGDILAYQGHTSLILHRAIDKRIADGKTIFVMHGNANMPGANEYLDEKPIVGKVVEIILSTGN